MLIFRLTSGTPIRGLGVRAVVKKNIFPSIFISISVYHFSFLPRLFVVISVEVFGCHSPFRRSQSACQRWTSPSFDFFWRRKVEDNIERATWTISDHCRYPSGMNHTQSYYHRIATLSQIFLYNIHSDICPISKSLQTFGAEFCTCDYFCRFLLLMNDNSFPIPWQ